MERSGASVAGAGHHADLAQLVLRDGPFLTVWAGGSVDPARAAVDAVGTEGPIAVEVAEQLGSELSERLAGGASAGGVIGIADPTGVLLVESLPEPPRGDIARVSPLPSLSPLVEHRQGTVPYIVALVDRRGADLHWSDGERTGERTVEAPDDMRIQKFKDSDSGSGSRQRDLQQKVENNWDRIAADVAAALVELSSRVNSRVITVAGDVRAVQLLRDHVPAEVAALMRDVPGTRHEDGAGELRDKAVRRWVRTAVAQETVEALNVFERERGQRDRAADGPAETFAALCEARVDVLLVHDDVDDERSAWFAREMPGIVALERTTIDDLRHEAVEGRLVDVAMRAALATSAGVRIIPRSGPVQDGVGAILRW